MFAIGRPIGTTPCPASVASTSLADDQIVVSVGPYTFHSRPTRVLSLPANSPGSASPPHSAFSPGRPDQPDSSSNRHVDGVACITVAPLPSSAADSDCALRLASRSSTTTTAPLISGRYSSSPAMSKPSVVTASQRSASLIASRPRIDSSRFTTCRCSTVTPFGRPVEPEV